MSLRSEVVWRADEPLSRVRVNWDALAAAAFHYRRLIQMTLTGKDCLK